MNPEFPFLGCGGRGEGGAGGVGRTMGNKAFYWDGLTLSTVVTQDLLATIFSSDNTRGNLFGGNLF